MSFYFSNANTRFQSVFMSAIVQPLAMASSSPLSRRLMDEARSYAHSRAASV